MNSNDKSRKLDIRNSVRSSFWFSITIAVFAVSQDSMAQPAPRVKLEGNGVSTLSSGVSASIATDSSGKPEHIGSAREVAATKRQEKESDEGIKTRSSSEKTVSESAVNDGPAKASAGTGTESSVTSSTKSEVKESAREEVVVSPPTSLRESSPEKSEAAARGVESEDEIKNADTAARVDRADRAVSAARDSEASRFDKSRP